MVFKRISALGSALLLALASLFALGFTSQAHALGTTRFWCEFSSNSSFGIGSNWNTNSDCSSGSSGAPVSGDSLVFDNSHLTSAIDVSNGLAGLDLNSITFQGNGSAGYDLTGNDISLDSGVSDIGTAGQTSTINLNITLTANQAFSSTGGNDRLIFGGNINLSTFSLGLTPNASANLGINTFSGSGGLTFNGASGGSLATYTLSNADSSYSGPVTINNEAYVKDSSGSLNALGSGTITINSGGALYLFDASSTATLTNNLKLSGHGDSVNTFGALVSCLGPSSCTSSNSKLTLSGSVGLNGNVEVVNGAYSGSPPSSSATFDFTGNVTYNSFSLTAFPSSNTVVDLPAISSGSGSSGTSSSTPKAPNTGVGLVESRTNLPLIGAVLIALSLVLTSFALSKRQSKTSSSRK